MRIRKQWLSIAAKQVPNKRATVSMKRPSASNPPFTVPASQKEGAVGVVEMHDLQQENHLQVKYFGDSLGLFAANSE